MRYHCVTLPLEQWKCSRTGKGYMIYPPVAYVVTFARLYIYGNSALPRALSAHSAAEFNISPGRWQHVWLVAIVPPERWG
jgi:hypothetical protein